MSKRCWTEVFFSEYFIFGRVISHFYVTSYLADLCVFWWLFTNVSLVTLVMRNLNLISVHSKTYLAFPCLRVSEIFYTFELLAAQTFTSLWVSVFILFLVFFRANWASSFLINQNLSKSSEEKSWPEVFQIFCQFIWGYSSIFVWFRIWSKFEKIAIHRLRNLRCNTARQCRKNFVFGWIRQDM